MVESAGGKSSGIDAVFPAPPSPRCTKGPYLPDAHAYDRAGLGIRAEIGHRIVDVFGRPDRSLEPGVFAIAPVEAADELQPALFAIGNRVERLLHLRREPDIDVVGEVAAQQLGHREGGEARDQRLALTEHVLAPLDSGDDRGVRGRPADALGLELLDERRFREAWRRQRVVALRVDAEQLQAAIRDAGAVHAIALPRRRQERFLVLELRERIVAAFDVGAAEPGKLDRLPARGEHGRARRGRRP